MSGKIPVEAIVFDFDGVLVESVDVKGEAFCALYAQADPSIQKKVLDYHLAYGGVSRFDKIRYFEEVLLDRTVSEAEIAVLADRFSTLVEARVVAAPWVVGAKDFLDKFHNKIPLFVASATPQAELDRIVHARNMETYFKALFGSPVKKSAHLDRLVQQQGFTPSRILMIGDTISDLKAANEAGTSFLGRVAPSQPFPFPEGTPSIADLKNLESRIVLAS